MLCPQIAVGHAVLPREVGRPLDVAEEKGDRSSRKTNLHAWIVSTDERAYPLVTFLHAGHARRPAGALCDWWKGESGPKRSSDRRQHR